MKLRVPYDPAAAVAHLRAGDPALGAVIERVGPFALELKPSRSLFEALLRAIVFQQLNGKAAGTIHGRVLDALEPHGGATPAALAKVSDAVLRAAGHTGAAPVRAGAVAGALRSGAARVRLRRRGHPA